MSDYEKKANEAIEWIEYHIDISDYDEDDDLLTALKMAVKALKKQISKKVTNNGYGVYFCPVCRGSVWQIRDESKYCFRCGQALDWSDEKWLN